ncbi:MAG: SRPBCC family protein [Gammaproteobacteria bacterium]
MRFLKGLFVLIILLIVVFFIGGHFLPEEWTVSRSTSIQAKPEQIYPFVSQFKKWEKWSPWNKSKDPSLKYTYSGSEEGVGAKQSWTSEKMGNGWMEFTEADPKTGVGYDLMVEMYGHKSTLHGNIQFQPQDDEQTIVVWTDHGVAGNSSLNRWMGLLVKPMLSKDLEQALSGLKKAAEHE